MQAKKMVKIAAIVSTLFVSAAVFAEDAATVLSDTAITAAVKTKIATDRALSDAKIHVTTKKGVVYLSGLAKSNTQADEVVEVAQSISSVKDVDTDKLKVKDSVHPLNDAYVTSKVKGMFVREKVAGDENVAAFGIKVETIDGVVTLSGDADNQAQADNAVKIAKTVVGVRDVKSDIKIKS